MNWGHLLFGFSGRIGRAGFWTGMALVVAYELLCALALAFAPDLREPLFWSLAAVLALPALFMALAIHAKRWHDRDKPGWWSLLHLAPVIGVIWIFVELGLLAGSRGANQYGPDPLA